MKQVLTWLHARWFLTALVILISTGLLLGSNFDGPTVSTWEQQVPKPAVTALVLFLMAFGLDSKKLGQSLRSPGPTLLAAGINALLLPLMALALLSLQRTPDLRIGLMISVATPSTLAAASVWTRKAGGNDAVSLLNTVLTNGLCFLTAPFWLSLAASREVKLDSRTLALDLLLVVLTPTLLGQLVRLWPRAGSFATRFKIELSVVAQSCVLFLVFLSACGGGVQLQRSGVGAQLLGMLVAWVCCVAMHSLALLIGNTGSRLLGFSDQDRFAVAISGSQKSLPTGVFLATSPSAFGGPDVVNGLPVPFAVFPMLMFHASQLFIDTVVAERFARSKQQPVERESRSDSAT